LPEIVRALRRGLTPNGEAMLAEQFAAAAAVARNTATVDEIARLTWRAHAEGQLHDAEAAAISEAAQARRAVLAGEKAPKTNLRPFWAFLEALRVHAARRCSALAGHAPSTATPRCGSCTGRVA
jgi:hypothetical protein